MKSRSFAAAADVLPRLSAALASFSFDSRVFLLERVDIDAGYQTVNRGYDPERYRLTDRIAGDVDREHLHRVRTERLRQQQNGLRI